MSQTSDPGSDGATAGESPTDEVAERSTDDTQSGGAAGTRDAQASGSTREASADDPDSAVTDQRSPRAAEEVEQDDRARADEQEADEQQADDGEGDDGEAAVDQQSEAERQKSAEEFAAQHDPDKHDLDAGEEFRQPGDWVADEQGPQEWDEEGNLVSGGGPGSEAARQPAAAGSGSSDTSDDSAPAAGSGRRVSDLGEVRDGGYSVGSAATIDDGAMPLGHPVKGWEDTKSYLTPDHPRYDDAEPHVWFTDPDAAERAGFHRAD
jgi:hypothetical protein